MKTAATSRAYYSDTIADFLNRSPDEILGRLTRASTFVVESTQRDAWLEQIEVTRDALAPWRASGAVYFEYVVPRVGRRIDVVLVIRHAIFVIEFKVGEERFTASASDQVWDYALDLKNFHQTSHDKLIAPVLIATRAPSGGVTIKTTSHNDRLLQPIHIAPKGLGATIQQVLSSFHGLDINPSDWEQGRYTPTPTIVEAAVALYGGHAVTDISRRDAGATNLTHTSGAITAIIDHARAVARKAICFVTGVPGAGKTLVGLDIATKNMDPASASYSVFLSGNGPLVAILQEALARDKVRRERATGQASKLGTARSEVKAFIQNVHHFRDDCIDDSARPPIEHVTLFDEAQRAWNREQTAGFMRRKKGRPDFAHSEPEFLISCMDRHPDWAVVVCLVGGGQEINTGEAGITEWIESLLRSFPQWDVHISPRLHDSEYGAGKALRLLEGRKHVHFDENLHLGVSMRSFRAEHVSAFVKSVLDLDQVAARKILGHIRDRYPIVLARDLKKAKMWVRDQARGSERYGIVVSSAAYRLKPHAIDVRSPTDPVHWFLDPKEDTRSSYYLEDAATEFQVQGLELDWACVVWDADFRHDQAGWQCFSFVGDRWNRINKPERQKYLKNAYRVLLTRARQGMVVVVPEGDTADPTRKPSFYDPISEYLEGIGLPTI